MSKIRLHGSSSGYTEIAPVAASGNNTLTLPNDGTIISKDSNGVIGVTSITVGTGVTIGDGKITCDGSALTSINAAQLVGVCTSGLTKTGGFGKILQVLYTESTASVTTTSSRHALLTQAITPASSSNKVLVIGMIHAGAQRSSNGYTMSSIYRGTTYAEDLDDTELARGFAGSADGGSYTYDSFTLVALDSPNTSSAQTYALTFGKGSVGTTDATTDARYSLTLIEVAA